MGVGVVAHGREEDWVAAVRCCSGEVGGEVVLGCWMGEEGMGEAKSPHGLERGSRGSGNSSNSAGAGREGLEEVRRWKMERKVWFGRLL